MIDRSWLSKLGWLYPVFRVLPTLGLLALPCGLQPVAAQTSSQDKIAPSLQAQMAANPAALLPIIIEMADRRTSS